MRKMILVLILVLLPILSHATPEVFSPGPPETLNNKTISVIPWCDLMVINFSTTPPTIKCFQQHTSS